MCSPMYSPMVMDFNPVSKNKKKKETSKDSQKFRDLVQKLNIVDGILIYCKIVTKD